MTKPRLPRLFLRVIGILLITAAIIPSAAVTVSAGWGDWGDWAAWFTPDPSAIIEGEAAVGGTLTAVSRDLKEGQSVSGYKWTFGEIVVEKDADDPTVTLTEEMYAEGSVSLVVYLAKPTTRLRVKKTFIIDNGLPVIHINTDDGQPVTTRSRYKGATMKVELTEDTAQYANLFTEGYAAIEIRGRGNSTWGQPKKPYKLKLSEKADMFGMGSSKHWILLANAYDGSHLRNMLSYNLSGELGMIYIKNIHVNVVFNGEYVGLYQLTENIRAEKGRVPVTNWESVAEDAAEAIGAAEGLTNKRIENLSEAMKQDLSWITSGRFESDANGSYTVSDYFDVSKYDTEGGYVIELDEYYDEESKFVTPEDVPIMIKSPEFLNTNDEMFDYIKDYIIDMEDALFSDDGYNGQGLHYSEYLDVDSFVDYWIVNQAFKSVELLFKSCFMYKDAGGKLTFGPVWDMDWSSGNHANLGGVCADPTAWNHNQSQDREYWYRAIYHLPYFVVQLEDRWWEVRDKIEAMIASMDGIAERITPAAEMDYELWNGVGGWKFEREVSELKEWLTERLEWMDEQLAKRDPNIMWLGIEQTSNLSITVFDRSGYAVPADTFFDETRDADLYYEGGGKLNVKVTVTDAATKSIDVYVNGLRQENVPVTDGSATFEVDTSKMNLAADLKRNVIHVIGRMTNGSTITGETYVSMYVDGAPVYYVKYATGSDTALGVAPASVQYVENEKFTLPSPTMTNEGFDFTGWNDGTSVYQPGDEYTVTADAQFTAVWEEQRPEINAVLIIVVAAAVLVAGAAVFAVVKLRGAKKKP